MTLQDEAGARARARGLWLGLVLGVLGACSRDKPSEAPAQGRGQERGEGRKIALLLPESRTARYQTHDRPLFEKRVRELCPECEVLYRNADQDANTQQAQAEAALAEGARVLVLDPVDSALAAPIVARARQARVPVISYDRLTLDAEVDYYVSFDNEQVGQLQARALVDRLKADGRGKGTVVVLNGAPTDHNARLLKAGAHRVLDGSGLVIGAEYDTPGWSPERARDQMAQALSRLGKERVHGVYAANDGTAGGAIEAMKAAGLVPLPPVTGQDAELSAIQRIIAGEQLMTVYKPIARQAAVAAELAVALLRGQAPAAGVLTGAVNNGRKEVPAILLSPVAVDRGNVRSTVLADGFWTAAQVCTGPYAVACRSAGIE